MIIVQAQGSCNNPIESWSDKGRMLLKDFFFYLSSDGHFVLCSGTVGQLW